MTKDDLLAIIADELGRIAPEVAFNSVSLDDAIQAAFDIDSMDFLNFIIALHERTGVNVPEADYARMRTIASAHAYLQERLGI
ncbi:MAG: acyl carrier protein [Hyphomonadaceae bacterium]|nr:acyl carrier protein [Hyphomonadaceae bacterium]